MLNRVAIIKALAELRLLGALTDDCKLENPTGYQMSRLPLEPVYSRALILANTFNCLEEMLITVAMLSVESIFYDPREKREEVSMLKDWFFRLYQQLMKASRFYSLFRQARTSKNHFASIEGDHLTYVSVYRESDEFLEKRRKESGENKVDKIMKKWCIDNFVNHRSLKHARDTYRFCHRLLLRFVHMISYAL